MAQQVCMGATLRCSFGVAPSVLAVLPTNRALAPTPVATIADAQPVVNVPPFGMCQSIANPAVASATAAALGTLTPMPCVPVPVGPWAPGSPTVLIGGVPALDSSCRLCCAWGGVISITTPGQVKVQLP